jgi:hypothetical protein
MSGFFLFNNTLLPFVDYFFIFSLFSSDILLIAIKLTRIRDAFRLSMRCLKVVDQTQCQIHIFIYHSGKKT